MHFYNRNDRHRYHASIGYCAKVGTLYIESLYNWDKKPRGFLYEKCLCPFARRSIQSALPDKAKQKTLEARRTTIKFLLIGKIYFYKIKYISCLQTTVPL